MPHLIFDTDFLSSFLQIERCELIREFYQVDHAWLPTAVYGELAQTYLLSRLIAIPWLRVPPMEPPLYEVLLQNSTFQTLGAGERACITLAYAQADTVLLMSDNKARRFAQSRDIITINIPAFLLACKMAGLVDIELMTQIIKDLRDKDFYQFRKDVRDELLKESHAPKEMGRRIVL